jgi:hypothetical protein
VAIINKLQGFYELKKLGIPTVNWKQYTNEVELDENRLWTVRVAVLKGKDLYLPRAVGVKVDEAVKFANDVYNKYRDNAMIIYYPYFNADKSGTLEVNINGYIIESVKKDLWNLVTYGKYDQLIIKNGDTIEIHGARDFLTDKEIDELLDKENIVRRRLGSFIREGKSILLEWSYAYDADINGNSIGDPYLVFYECRTL